MTRQSRCCDVLLDCMLLRKVTGRPISLKTERAVLTPSQKAAAAERAESQCRQLQSEAEKAVQHLAQEELLVAEKRMMQLQQQYSQ